MPYVQSSAISRIEWENGYLSVWFHDSRRYDHAHIPEELYFAFLDAPSKGQFYNDFIREAHR